MRAAAGPACVAAAMNAAQGLPPTCTGVPGTGGRGFFSEEVPGIISVMPDILRGTILELALVSVEGPAEFTIEGPVEFTIEGPVEFTIEGPVDTCDTGFVTIELSA